MTAAGDPLYFFAVLKYNTLVMNDNYFYSENSNIRAYEVDFTGKLLPSGLLVRTQEISEDHGVILGIGREDIIKSRGLCWMILHMHFEADRYPYIADKIRTRTWAYVESRACVRRNYVFEDPEGRPYFRGTSEWVLFRLEEKKLALPKAIEDLWSEKKLVDDPAPYTKRQRPNQHLTDFAVHRVLYSDCDMNRHMNNVKYLDSVLDSYPVDFVLSNEIAEFDMTYVGQASLGDELVLRKYEDGAVHYISGFVGENNIFNTILKWRNITKEGR